MTKSGNVAGPGYVKISNWINNVWNDMNSDILKKSFKCCGITSVNKEDFNNQLKGIVKKNLKIYKE